jgi:hypothetical protein
MGIPEASSGELNACRLSAAQDSEKAFSYSAPNRMSPLPRMQLPESEHIDPFVTSVMRFVNDTQTARTGAETTPFSEQAEHHVSSQWLQDS